MEWKPGKNLLLAGICLLPFLAPAQEYFESPREHDYQITLQNGTEAGVTVTESWHESRKIRSFCGKLEWNQYPNGRFPIISTLEGVGGYSTIEKARLLDLGRQMGVTPPENRRTITPEWLRAFQSALASSLGDTPFAVDFADTAQTTFYRGEEDCQ